MSYGYTITKKLNHRKISNTQTKLTFTNYKSLKYSLKTREHTLARVGLVFFILFSLGDRVNHFVFLLFAAFNDAGESFSTCTINVLVPGEEPKSPAFAKFPNSITVPAGESAKFECELQENVLQLNWLKDGKPIEESSPRYKLTIDGNKYNIEIVSCSVSDIGQYQAKAIGKKGETFAAFSVNVSSTEQ